MPLRIFEERYKLMMRRCLETDSQFGVVLIKSGSEVGEPAEPYRVGTVAGINQTSPLNDGELLIAVTGQRRFLIREITQLRPYLEGQVELLEDEEGVSLSQEKLDEVRSAVTDYVRQMAGLSGGWLREAPMPRDPVALSYYIPGLLDVDPLEKQHLLEEPSASGRLEAELGLLARETAAARKRVTEELGTRRFGRN